jgi:hypothetical protein
MGNDLELASTSVLIKVPPQPQDKLRGISCLLFAAINLLLPATSGSFRCASGPVPNRPAGKGSKVHLRFVQQKLPCFAAGRAEVGVATRSALGRLREAGGQSNE